MGCDIHLILEKKVNDKWLGVWATDSLPNGWSLPITHRNYEFFSNLANVRSEKPESNRNRPKGLPSNISELAKISIANIGDDGHSHSYFTVDEFIEIFLKSYNKDEIDGLIR